MTVFFRLSAVIAVGLLPSLAACQPPAPPPAVAPAQATAQRTKQQVGHCRISGHEHTDGDPAGSGWLQGELCC